jgi:seryl-tRNA synthetase
MQKSIISAVVVITIISIIAVVSRTNTKVELQQIDLKTKQQEIETLKTEQSEYEQKLKDAHGDKKKLDQLKQEQQELQDENKRLQSELQAKLDKQASEATNVAYASPETVTGDCATWMSQAGITNPEIASHIFHRESGCSPLASNPSSAAHGVCQSLPASKMASHGSDYLTNPITQMKWCQDYAISRYGSWSGAWSFWQANHWW